MDWGQYSFGGYFSVIPRFTQIAKMLGKLLMEMFDRGLDINRLHCVGLYIRWNETDKKHEKLLKKTILLLMLMLIDHVNCFFFCILRSFVWFTHLWNRWSRTD